MRLADPATIAWTCAVPLRTRVSTEAVNPTASGNESTTSPTSSRSFAPLERRAGVSEGPRGRGQLLGAALRANRVGLEQPGAFDDEPTRPHPISLVAQYELGLAGEVGLVEGEPAGRHERSVSHDLVACRDSNRVADDDILDRHPDLVAVAHHDRFGRDQRREPVELALGTDLLERANRDVRDDDPQEQGVTP
jgi:hypothetical protein